MKITTVRRISQIFFFILFLWFCIAATFGESFRQLRGWPVNWFLQLDPLVALGNLITTRTLYAGLAWAGATVALTLVLGRFFCGWVCPFGSMHHFVGYLGSRGRRTVAKIEANRYRSAQKIKYYILTVLLLAAAAQIFRLDGIAAASLQTGLLDPIPLVTRSVNLVLLPLADSSAHLVTTGQRHYGGAWLIGTIFFAALLLNLVIPRFYCRIICPLGALYGVIGRFALWRIGKKQAECSECRLCDLHCEGACSPAEKIRVPECVLCMNCLHTCRDGLVGYHTFRSAAGEIASPDLSRRGFVVASVCGVAALPLLRINGALDRNWDPALVRPPGSLAEPEFLDRCIKCGQCARVCPTNVIQPAEWDRRIEALWTPVLNFRTGSSGCQMNCTACGHICPTAAIRPLSPEEKLGRGTFEKRGPIRIGTAFVDRTRCLPWAMDRPCIVCQENCPVSPKAIFVKESFATVRGGNFEAAGISGSTVELKNRALVPDRFGTGDYFVSAEGERRRIVSNSEKTITLDQAPPSAWTTPGPRDMELQVRLQAPQVDPERCTGCGICEHECPVSGLRAIRVSAEGESRHRKHSLLLK